MQKMRHAKARWDRQSPRDRPRSHEDRRNGVELRAGLHQRLELSGVFQRHLRKQDDLQHVRLHEARGPYRHRRGISDGRRDGCGGRRDGGQLDVRRCSCSGRGLEALALVQPVSGRERQPGLRANHPVRAGHGGPQSLTEHDSPLSAGPVVLILSRLLIILEFIFIIGAEVEEAIPIPSGIKAWDEKP